MKTPIDIYVMEKVRDKRIEMKLSQEELSIKAGFKSNGFVGQVESLNYSKKYNINHLNLFAQIFDCSPKLFLPDVWITP